MLKRFRWTEIAACLLVLAMPGAAWPECYGDSDMIGNVCWTCFFPISICGASVANGEDHDTSGGECICRCPNYSRTPGIMISYWAPVYVAEVVKQPYCSPFLGGQELSHKEGLTLRGSKNATGDPRKSTAFYNLHFIEYPIASIMRSMDNANACYRLSDNVFGKAAGRG